MAFTIRIVVAVTEEMADAIDEARDLISVSAWARRAFTEQLAREGFHPADTDDG